MQLILCSSAGCLYRECPWPSGDGRDLDQPPSAARQLDVAHEAPGYPC